MRKGGKMVRLLRGPKGWTTEAQEQYLLSLIPSYLSAQSSKTLGDFWPVIWEGWFGQWESPPVTEEEEKKGTTAASKLKATKIVGCSCCY